MKRLFILLCFLTSIQNINAQIIDERTGVEIYFEVDEYTFPSSWKSDRINAKGVSLAETEIERSTDIIKKALKKYPKEVLQINLKKIYILKSIEFFGQGYGGTNSNDVVYIANDGIDLGYTDYYLEKSFHHEYSSILLRNYPEKLNEEKWRAINELDYGDGGVNALKTGKTGQAFLPELNEKGFLYKYAVSSFENDINSFAENLFIPKEGFYMAVQKNPKLMRKFRLIIDFYNSIDDTFTKSYFIQFNERNNEED